MKVTKSKKRKSVPLQSTSVLAAINAVQSTVEHLWIKGIHVTCQNGDLARQGSWVFASSPIQPVRHSSTVSIARSTCLIPQLLTDREPLIQGFVFIGKITDILVSQDSSATPIVSIERFELSTILHSQFEMPVLYQPQEEASYINISNKVCSTLDWVQRPCI